MSASKNLKLNHFKLINADVHPNTYVKLNPDSIGNYQNFEQANNYYFILSGDVLVTYAANNFSHIITSPYGSGLFNYIDSIPYNENISIKLTSNSHFTWLVANTPEPLNVRVGKLSNDTINTNVNANSVLLIYGNDIVCNGNTLEYTSNNDMYYHRINFSENQNISISTTNNCICFLIDWV